MATRARCRALAAFVPAAAPVQVVVRLAWAKTALNARVRLFGVFYPQTRARLARLHYWLPRGAVDSPGGVAPGCPGAGLAVTWQVLPIRHTRRGLRQGKAARRRIFHSRADSARAISTSRRS